MPDAAMPEPDTGEFEAVYTQHFPLVWRTLRRFGVPPASLEDAAQDVFLIWHRQRDSFRGESQVAGYLYSIARRVAANARRTAWRTERRHQALVQDEGSPPPGPEEKLAHSQAALAFERAIAGLPTKLREVYLLAVQDGLTAQQIGLALNISANTVSSRIRLSRARLATELRDLLPTAPAEQPPAAARSRVWLLLAPLLLPEAVVLRPARAASPFMLAAAALLVTTALVAAFVGLLGGAEATRAIPATPLRPAAPPLALAPEPAPELVPEHSAPPPPPRPRDPADPLVLEARMLAAAQRRLRDGDPDGALIQLRQHTSRFAAGVLVEERDALIAAALCQRGELAAGRSATAELALRAPTSAALATARAACQPRSGEPLEN